MWVWHQLLLNVQFVALLVEQSAAVKTIYEYHEFEL